MSNKYQRSSSNPYQRPSSESYQRSSGGEQAQPKEGQSISLSWDEAPSPKQGSLRSLRMSKKAKAKLKKRKCQKDALIEMIEGSTFNFSEDDLEGRDYSGKLNIELCERQYKSIIDAAKSYKVPYYVIISALVLKGVKK